LVKVRKGDQELGERVVLATEEGDEVLGECACGVHACIVSRAFVVSWSARI
jgi:hypothetical protein